MKKQVLLLIMMVLPMVACAYDAEIDGIYYNFNSGEKTATVTKQDYKSGDIIIPSEVTYKGKKYSVTTIGSAAFADCSGLTSIEIPNSVTSIGENAFYGCRSLTSVTIGNSVTVISSNAFQGCSGLTSVTIPNSVTSIGNYAFYGCSGLASVTIPNSVTSIGRQAFGGTEWSNNQTDDLIYINNILCGYKGSLSENVKIKDGTISISPYAFYGCSGLTSVTIPNSVTSIGERAFSGCYRLNTIYSLNPIPPTCYDSSTFECSSRVRDKYDVYTYATLHVPMGSEEVYSSAHEWRYFNKIKEDMESGGKVHYANLTVQQGTTGYTRQAMKAAERYTIYIGSLGENRVNAVTFNGEDVTDDVVDGYYTTPEIKGESVLSISFEAREPSYVKARVLADVRVTGYNGEISINHIDEPSDVYIYTTDGKLVNKIPAAFGSTSLQVPSGQLYVVKVGERTYKLAM